MLILLTRYTVHYDNRTVLAELLCEDSVSARADRAQNTSRPRNTTWSYHGKEYEEKEDFFLILKELIPLDFNKVFYFCYDLSNDCFFVIYTYYITLLVVSERIVRGLITKCYQSVLVSPF